MSKTGRVSVGVGVWVARGGKVLGGFRLNAHGEGDWFIPGGALEPGESSGACAAREFLEETGLRASEFEFLGVTNDVFAPDNHWVTVFMKALDAAGEPACREPHTCAAREWRAPTALPDKLFLPVRHFLAHRRL